MIDLTKITIGSDPEYAAFDENGTPVSGVGFVPGTKKEPFPLSNEELFSIQIDNVGVEACIPPATTRGEFVYNMMTAKDLCDKKLKEVQPTWSLRSVSSARFSNKELDSDTARLFGCEPSWCVYTQQISPRPSPSEVGNLRSFGFHIHVGFKCSDTALDYAEKIIKAMDIYCGLPSIIIDTDGDRRSIYGNAGDFRFRQIGDLNIVEYRTLGGALHDDPAIIGWLYDQTIKAVEMANTEMDHSKDLLVEAAINNADLDSVQELLNYFKIELPHGIRIAVAVPTVI